MPIVFDKDKTVPLSACVECGYKTDRVSGDAVPGSYTLCMTCGSLNIFDANMKLRMPTLDEFLKAAANSNVQMLRKTILKVQKDIGGGKSK